MAGLFRVPKPVVVPPPAPPPAAATETATAAGVSRDTEAEAARIEGRIRARTGLAGTVATSDRGVLAAVPFVTGRKSLLGE